MAESGQQFASVAQWAETQQFAMVIATFLINLCYSKFAGDIDPYSLRECSLLGGGMDCLTNLLYTGTHAGSPSYSYTV